MRRGSPIIGISAAATSAALLVLASAMSAPAGTLAAPASQPQATATVEARQTATAQAVPTTLPPVPAPTPATVNGSLVAPEQRKLTDELLRSIKLPPGFWVNVFARDLGNVRFMAIAPDGSVYATRREQGDVLLLRDTDGDGSADSKRVVASDLPYINGITLHQGRLYLATDRRIVVGDVRGDGTLGSLRTVVDDLPDAGQHPNRTLAFGPDGYLYVTVGSTCNVCKETNKESASILRMRADGSERTVYAKGLRNTIGFGWHPGSGQLWGMDHGTDWRGDDQPPEELNLIQQSGNYGWPYCFGGKQPDPYFSQDPAGTTKQAYCATTQAPVLTYQAHSAPLGMAFYMGGQFPAEYQGDAFVAMRGSWNRSQPTGYKVVRIHYQNGWPARIDDFMSGFLIESGGAQFARLAGVAVAPYGSLFVADDSGGVIYRVSYVGK